VGELPSFAITVLLDQAGAVELAAVKALSTAVAPFPAQFPARWESAGVRFSDQAGAAVLAPGRSGSFSGVLCVQSRPGRRRRAGPGSRPSTDEITG